MRVAVAHASAGVVDVIARIVDRERPWRIAWTTGDGQDAVTRCTRDPADVVLLGVTLGTIDGVEATRRIMHAAPCVILVITDRGVRDARRVFDALGAGAVDSVDAPWIDEDGRLAGADDIVRKIRTAARAAGLAPSKPARTVEPAVVPARPHDVPQLVAIGASTGGPAAIATVIAAFPERFPAAVVVIQHVDAKFCSELAKWLGEQSRLPVRAACNGERLEEGSVMLAGRDDDLIVRPDLTLGYQKPGDGSFYHPSVDVFFASVARHWPKRGIAALLTGIGRDGAEGLLALRRKGWRTVAQDEATSIVYGMPKAAATLNAASDVLPIEQVGPAIVRFVSPRQFAERGARE
jgi:chemotaxis response regulator CheB